MHIHIGQTCASLGSLPLYFSWISFTFGCKAWIATVDSTCTASTLQPDNRQGGDQDLSDIMLPLQKESTVAIQGLPL